MTAHRFTAVLALALALPLVTAGSVARAETVNCTVCLEGSTGKYRDNLTSDAGALAGCTDAGNNN